MSEGEDATVNTRMRVTLVGEQIVWSWTRGQCTVALSLPNVEPMADETYRDVQFLVEYLPELINSGTTEAQVELFKMQMEDELDELSAEEG